jgi:hypothetical protein
MSNVEQEIVDLVGEVLDDKVEDAISNNYELQDLRDRLDNLESMGEMPNEDEIMMRLARLIIKDDPANRAIVFQTHLDKLNKEIEDLKKALADKENV